MSVFDFFLALQRFRSFCSSASRGVGLRIWVGILVVLLRGVNFGFWSHLGCSGHMYIFSSLLGVKKAWATPKSVSFTGLIQNFRRASPPLSYAESSPRALHNVLAGINSLFGRFAISCNLIWYYCATALAPPVCKSQKYLMSFCVGNDFDMLNSFLSYGLRTQMSHIRVKNHPFSTFPITSSFYASYPTRFDACNAGHVPCGFAVRPLRLLSIYDDAKSFYTRLFWDP